MWYAAVMTGPKHARRLGLLFVCLLLPVAPGCGLDPIDYARCETGNTCQPYCERLSECGLASQADCCLSCLDRTDQDLEPFGGRCVFEQDCTKASHCILCDQYCAKLDECGLSTSGCYGGCETLLAGGASAEGYQCVVDAECEDVSNCGI